MNAYCKKFGIGLIPWGPMADGRLTRPINAPPTIRSEVYKSFGMHKYTDADKEIIKRVGEIAKKRGWGMGQVALAWVGGKVDSPSVGVTSVSSCFYIELRAVLMMLCCRLLEFMRRLLLGKS